MDQIKLKQNARMRLCSGIEPAIPLVYQVDSDQLPSQTYIIESKGALKILLEPWLVGAGLANSARESTVDFLRIAYHIVPELRETNFSDITEVVPLAGALYYSTAEAFELAFGETINRCFIGAKRFPSPLGWVTELSYKNFEALPEKPLVIIGDTIATGGTIEGILDATLAQETEVKAIVIYSIAGGVLGCARLKRFENRANIPLYVFFSNAIFGVESNGTDMPWLHPATIVSNELLDLATSTYGTDLGRRWCSIWDWGDRSKHPLKHLNELLARCDSELSKNPEPNTEHVLKRIIAEATEALERWNSAPKL
ncbi:MAG: hypothetical protein ACFFEF_01645 [Candidatus Thorarchaeota archaeon]